MEETSLAIPGRPDTSLDVQLHPLVLLTISDYITRHSVRQQIGPAVGAIIGQQNGRSFSLEFAFECKLADADEERVELDGAWFSTRLDMYKEVHKSPTLDLVAIFTTSPVTGPYPQHLPILQQVKNITGSDNVLLLLFHPDTVDELQGGKLPISLFEAVEESENKIRFRKLAYDVETGDAERIGVDFVAKGGGSATAVAKASSDVFTYASKGKGKAKGKARDEEGDVDGTSTSVLSVEDDELISSLQTKVNAIKMLSERLNLIRSFLTSQPQSYLVDASSAILPPESTNHQVLRSVHSVLSRLQLLASPQAEQGEDGTVATIPLQHASEHERQDVHLTSLLASLTQSVAEAQTLGSRFKIVQKEKQNKDRSPLNSNRGRGGYGEEAFIVNNGGLEPN